MRDNIPIEKGKISFPEVSEQPISWGRHGNVHQTEKFKAIVDSKSGKVFSIVSQDYKLLRHEQAIERAEKAIRGVLELGEYEAYTEFYNDGGRMRRTYRFCHISAEIAKGDMVNPVLHLFNSYDLSWPFIVLLGAYRVVCENGAVVFEELFEVRKKHIHGMEKLYLDEQISTALQRFERQARQWRQWTSQQLTEKTYRKVMAAINFGKKAKKEIESRFDQEAQGYEDSGFPVLTIWIFYNILTWYITHRAVSLNHRVEMERRLRASMVYLGRR